MQPQADNAAKRQEYVWQTRLVSELRDGARQMRAEASRLDALAAKIEKPPDGVRVEWAGFNTVRFVGPVVEAQSV